MMPKECWLCIDAASQFRVGSSRATFLESFETRHIDEKNGKESGQRKDGKDKKNTNEKGFWFDSLSAIAPAPDGDARTRFLVCLPRR